MLSQYIRGIGLIQLRSNQNKYNWACGGLTASSRVEQAPGARGYNGQPVPWLWIELLPASQRVGLDTLPCCRVPLAALYALSPAAPLPTADPPPPPTNHLVPNNPHTPFHPCGPHCSSLMHTPSVPHPYNTPGPGSLPLAQSPQGVSWGDQVTSGEAFCGSGWGKERFFHPNSWVWGKDSLQPLTAPLPRVTNPFRSTMPSLVLPWLHHWCSFHHLLQ